MKCRREMQKVSRGENRKRHCNGQAGSLGVPSGVPWVVSRKGRTMGVFAGIRTGGSVPWSVLSHVT